MAEARESLGCAIALRVAARATGAGRGVVAARTKASAVQLEEATPAAPASEEGLAPEEVRAKKRGREELQRSQEEATRDERKAQRLAKKKARNAKRKKRLAAAAYCSMVGRPQEPREAKVLEGSSRPKVGTRGSTAGRASSGEQLQEEVRRRCAAVRPRRRDPRRNGRRRARRRLGGDARLRWQCLLASDLASRPSSPLCGEVAICDSRDGLTLWRRLERIDDQLPCVRARAD